MHYIFFIIVIFFSCATTQAQIVINEYSAANHGSAITGFIDNYGDFEDWFELYNPSGSAIDLNGYYLSDKSDNLTKWQISAPLSIAPNEYQIVFCSGRDEIIGGDVHTSYKLHQTKGNEWIILTNPDGITVEDSIWVRPCLLGHSRGRITDGNTNWGVFTNPSPASINNGSMQEYAQNPSLSPIPGIFAGATDVTISANPGSTIYYTTDGSYPDETDNEYIGPININGTTVLKAVVYDPDPNILPSFMTYGTYFIGTNHSLPILSISGRESNNPNDNELYELIADGVGWVEPIGTFEIYDVNGNLLDAAVGEFNEHGNDSWAYAQRGFDYITRDQFGYNHAIQHNIFRTKERSKYQRLIVKAAANDNYPFSYGSSGAHIRDAYVQSLSQVAELRMDERSFEPCVMYLNGEYWGVYELREKVDDLDFTDYYYDQDSVEFLKTWGGTWVDVLVDGQNDVDVENSWNNLVNYITTNDMSDAASYDYVKSVYNTGSLIDYYILNSYIVNSDWLNWNTAWWHGLRPEGDKKKWRYILWDMDNTFDHGANYTGVPNQSPLADPCDPENIENPPGEGHIPIWNALLNNEEFFDDYINRWSDLSNTFFSCEFMINHLDSLINLIEPEMQMQIDRWGGSYAEWQENVQDMKDFMQERCNFLNSGIVDCYDVEGPYTINVVIQGEGEVQLNDIDISNLSTPWNGDYFGGVDIDFSINDPTNFSFFEIISEENYNYDSLSSEFSLDLLGDITIIFYFNANEIVYLVEPQGSGSINVNGTTASNFPFTEFYASGENITLSAIPNAGWQMDYWNSNNHNFNPSSNDVNVNFTTLSDDTIILYLKPENEIVYIVEPPGTANINISGTTINTFPHTEPHFFEENIGLTALPNTGWQVNYWGSNNQNFMPNSNEENVNFTLISDDTITLYLEPIVYNITVIVDPPFSEVELNINGTSITSFPYTTYHSYGTTIDLEASSSTAWEFSHWTSTFYITNQSNSMYQTFDIVSSDTLVIHYIENTLYDISYDINPREGGNLYVNNTPINIFPFEQTYLEDSNITIKALPNVGWRFANWSVNNNTTILPNSTTKDAYFQAKQEDHIVANFEEIFEVFVPNAFTPDNGDFEHDSFEVSVYTIHDFEYHIKIFNRLGEPIFESNDANNNWDGSYQKTGKQAPNGVYIYVLKVTSSYSKKKIEKKGTITILR